MSVSRPPSNAERPLGRRPKLTKQLIEKAEKLLAAGNYAKVVGRLCGISETSWYRWLDRGREIEEAFVAAEENREDPPELTDHEAHVRQFCQSITRADAEAEATALEAWTRFFPRVTVRTVCRKDGTVTEEPVLVGDYRAARDFLERRHRNRWSPRAEVTGADGGPIHLTGLEIEVVEALPDPEPEEGDESGPRE